jgi:hypothetical protein
VIGAEWGPVPDVLCGAGWTVGAEGERSEDSMHCS